MPSRPDSQWECKRRLLALPIKSVTYARYLQKFTFGRVWSSIFLALERTAPVGLTNCVTHGKWGMPRLSPPEFLKRDFDAEVQRVAVSVPSCMPDQGDSHHQTHKPGDKTRRSHGDDD